MRDAQIDDMVDELEAFDWVSLRKRLKRLNQRDRAGTVIPDGYSSRTINGDIPAKDPEALTPTERVADVRGFEGVRAGPPILQGPHKGEPDGSETARPLERDPVHEANVHALSALGQAITALGGLVNHLCRGEDVQKWEKPIGQTSTPCKIGPCDTEAIKRGFCDTCNRADLRWQEKHNEPMPVALMEQAAEQRQTKKRRRVA